MRLADWDMQSLARSLCHDATDIELEECVSVSCRSGFSETGLELTCGISDCQRQKRCYEVWQQNPRSPLLSSQLPASQSHKYDSCGNVYKIETLIS